MKEFRTYRVDAFLLSDEWIEPETFGAISYVIRGGDNEEEHHKFVEKFKQELAYEHDDDYTSWVFTHSRYKDLGGFNPYATVIHFRVRDAG